MENQPGSADSPSAGDGLSPRRLSLTPPSSPQVRIHRDFTNNNNAVIGMALGIFTFLTCQTFCFVGIPGMIWSILGLKGAKRQGGRGVAIAGIVLNGISSLVCLGVAGLLILPMVFGDRNGHKLPCINRQKQLSLAILMYAHDNDEVFPESGTESAGWRQSIGESIDNDELFICPNAPKEIKNGIGYNAKLSGVQLGDIPFPQYTIVTADAVTGNITQKSDIDLFRHGEKPNQKGYVATFTDGSAKWFPASKPFLELDIRKRGEKKVSVGGK